MPERSIMPDGFGPRRLAPIDAPSGIARAASSMAAGAAEDSPKPGCVPCFAAGTLIATAQGEVPVERLRAGDLVVTALGGASLQPVIWMGHSRIDVARHRDPRAVAPVLIGTDALGEGMPHRPLRVSPDHGIHLEGCLVPAGLLVTGTSIVQELWCPAVTYWHVELPAHALLVSDGVVAESYLDDGNRAQFDNHGITVLFKDFSADGPKARRGPGACLPVVTGGEALGRIRARLLSRAAGLRDAPARLRSA
ncbi:Hint domain-containing protein [Roseomonas sp. JC162]|uniref:Hint domain-containing protein n=1 Tax=Neoroseomonas marina TaxID=1232220 RepID=A0A848EH16_9PROT|nr:Hint domain-containing protein [Neoroseomonas marina]NMJ43292.1 Hint domain-containing protein [Neoroseomonas marina]